jgi:probable phosphoglycerate mutase
MSRKEKWPTSLWIVRHARSYAQEKRQAAEKSGALSFDLGMPEDQAPLVERGRKQAIIRGKWFRNLPVDQRPTVILVSPYVRTRQTAELISKQLGVHPSKVRIIVEDRLRELVHGDYSYFTEKGMQQLHPDEVEKLERMGPLDYSQPNGENRWDVVARLHSLIADLQTVYAGERVLLVTHSAVVRCIRYLLENLDEQQFLQIVHESDAANASVTSYVRRGRKLVPAPVPYLGDPLAHNGGMRRKFVRRRHSNKRQSKRSGS